MMNAPAHHLEKRARFPLVPFVGFVLFILLYFLAAALYPGGSDVNPHAPGFSWINNYWCNLLNERALNGLPNPARWVAYPAMMILAFAMAVFWYAFPACTGLGAKTELCARITGSAALLPALFLASSYHDALIKVSAVLAIPSLFILFRGLLNLRWPILFTAGLIAVVLMALNNLLYWQNRFTWLPLLQGFTFLYVTSWAAVMAAGLYRAQAKPARIAR